MTDIYRIQAWVLRSCAVLLMAAIPAQAMTVVQFDKMADRDQGAYIQLLIDGAQEVLIKQGQRDLAAEMYQLFTKIPKGDQEPLGLTEFEINLNRVRLVDAKNVAKNPNAERLQVEHAMILTLKDNQVTLPKTFMSVGNNFKPKYPPQSK